MAGSVATIEAGYARILHDDKPGEAFAKFESLVDAWTFDEEELAAHIVGNRRTQDIINRVRSMKTSVPGCPEGQYFAGSGLVVVATNEKIVAADYRCEEGDHVARQYGEGYRSMGLIKVGRAALASRLVGTNDSFIDGYIAVENELHDEGYTGNPHTIGYAWGRNEKRIWTAGATGMVATGHTQGVIETIFDHVVPRDQELGRVSWQGDYFAGYHDQVAAAGVVGIVEGRTPQSVMPSVTELDAHAVNLH